MKVEEPGEYGNKSKNSMYETVYAGLFNFGNILSLIHISEPTRPY